MKFYTYDLQCLLTGEIEQSPKMPVPPRSTTVEPPVAPEGKVPQFNRGKREWVLIDESQRLVDYKPAEIVPTLEEVKEAKLAELKAHCDAKFKDYLSKYPEVEVDSFKVKAAEANLVAKDLNTDLLDTPYLSELTGYDKETRNAWALATLAKIKEAAQLELFGATKRTEIKACTTVEEVNAVELAHVDA